MLRLDNLKAETLAFILANEEDPQGEIARALVALVGLGEAADLRRNARSFMRTMCKAIVNGWL